MNVPVDHHPSNDGDDARGLAHLLRTGLYREVRVKSRDDMRKRVLLRARATVLRASLDLANAIRGALRTFGLARAAGEGNGGARAFEHRAVERLSARPDPMQIVEPLLDARAAPPGRRWRVTTGRSGPPARPTHAAGC